MSAARAPDPRDPPRHHRQHPQGGGEARAGRSKRLSASSTGSLGRGALSDPDLQSRLQPNLPAFWVRIMCDYGPLLAGFSLVLELLLLEGESGVGNAWRSASIVLKNV
uniref:Uncharacterized protein n=1 Tax=Heliothis virescens TaxID=7102 RepID=A0A2A4JL88_HELVI